MHVFFALLMACVETGLVPADEDPGPPESTDTPTDTAPQNTDSEDTGDTAAGSDTTDPELAPDIEVTPNLVTFAADQTEPVTVTIANVGTGPLEVYDVLIQGEDLERFAHTGQPVEIQAGGKAEFDLYFDPDACQPYGADLVVYSDDPEDIQVVVPITAEAPTVCPFDDVWFSNGDELLLRVDQATNSLLSTIKLPSGFIANAGLAVDDTSVWLAGSNASMSGLVQVDKASEAVGLHAFGSAITSVAVDETDVWAGSHGDQTIYRLDKATGAIEDQVVVTGGYPTALDVEGDHLWVAIFETGSSYPYEGRVAKLDKTSLEELGSVTFEGYPDVYTGNTSMSHYPTGVLAWADHVWVAVSNEDLIWRIDVDTLAAEALVTATSRPVSLSRDADHLFTAHKHGAETAKVESDGTVVSATPMAEYLNNVSVGDLYVWLVQQQGGVARLDKETMAVLESYQTYGETWHTDVHPLGDMTGQVYWERYLAE